MEQQIKRDISRETEREREREREKEREGETGGERKIYFFIAIERREEGKLREKSE